MALAVIFDMDGVLVDSFQAHVQAWTSMAQHEGLPFDPARFTASFGRTSRELFAELWPDRSYTDAEHEDLANRREASYRRIVQASFPEMPGARELIQDLHRDGFALALGSSGPRENADLVLQKLAARDLFHAVVTGKDVRRGKPDPEVFLTAAARLGIAPRFCAVIEDAPSGIAAANSGGMLSIGFSGSGPAYRPLSDARLVVHSLAELSPALIRRELDNFASNTCGPES